MINIKYLIMKANLTEVKHISNNHLRNKMSTMIFSPPVMSNVETLREVVVKANQILSRRGLAVTRRGPVGICRWEWSLGLP